MALTIPADLELFEPNELLGLIKAGQDPVHTLMRRINWHCATHAPACVDVAPDHAPAASVTVIVPVMPSADGLTYDATWQVYAAATGTVDIDLQESTTYGGAYTSVSAYPWTTASITAGNVLEVSYSAVLTTTTRFLKLIVNNGAGNVQLQGFTLAPQKLASLVAGTQPSGWCGYDDSALTCGSAPIHTEYWLRAQTSVRAVYSDRRQAVWSYTQPSAAPRVQVAAIGQQTTLRFALASADLPVTAATDLTVYCRAADSGGATEGTILVGQAGSQYEPAKLLADNTDRTDTFTWDPGGQKAIYATVSNPNGTVTPYYVTVEWTPDISSTIPIIGSVAPPPLHEYLTALDQLTSDACLLPYAATGKAWDASQSGTYYWTCGLQVGPGIHALRCCPTISRDGFGSTSPPSEMWVTDAGTTANDLIYVESPVAGSLVYPPRLTGQVVPGTEYYDDTPTGASYRLADMATDREPRYQAVKGRYYCGWGYRPLRLWPQTDLP